jgi:hypothetical protein
MTAGDSEEWLTACEACHAVIEEVSGWRWASVAPGPRSGLTELLARRRLFAHVIEDWDGGAAVGLLLPEVTADRLVTSGAAQRHPMIPTRGWVLIVLRTAEDLANALGFAREAYERAVPRLTAV